MTPPASIVIPTRARLSYLEVALASIAPPATDAGAELLVVAAAGSAEEAAALGGTPGRRYEPHPGPLGLNVARNTGVERSSGELVVFVDDDVEVREGWLDAPLGGGGWSGELVVFVADDVEVREGWLDALLAGAREHPERDVFTGPILPRLEGSP